MYYIKKFGIIFFVIVACAISNPLGVTKVRGNFIIPTAEQIKNYKCIIYITDFTITLECEKKIFHPFNLFDIPKKSKINLYMAEVEKIEVQTQTNMIFIMTKKDFFMRYKNYFHQSYIYSTPFDYTQIWVMACLIDKPADILVIGKELKRIIGDRCVLIN